MSDEPLLLTTLNETQYDKGRFYKEIPRYKGTAV